MTHKLFAKNINFYRPILAVLLIMNFGKCYSSVYQATMLPSIYLDVGVYSNSAGKLTLLQDFKSNPVFASSGTAVVNGNNLQSLDFTWNQSLSMQGNFNSSVPIISFDVSGSLTSLSLQPSPSLGSVLLSNSQTTQTLSINWKQYPTLSIVLNNLGAPSLTGLPNNLNINIGYDLTGSIIANFINSTPSNSLTLAGSSRSFYGMLFLPSIVLSSTSVTLQPLQPVPLPNSFFLMLPAVIGFVARLSGSKNKQNKHSLNFPLCG